MEFKDRLKKLRKEKGLSQQSLADAIYVSRSAVAKWENGLGYPSEVSYIALMEYFNVERSAFETEKIEDVLIQKNKQIYRMKNVLITVVGLVLLMIAFVISVLCLSEDYGFTSKIAAGSYAYKECIHLEDYDIYWYTIMAEEEYASIDGFRPVKRNFYGYTVNEEDYRYRDIYCNGQYVGIFYSIEGENGYYNIIKKNLNLYPKSMLQFDEVEMEGMKYEVLINSFFITEQPVKEFRIGEDIFVVEDVIRE